MKAGIHARNLFKLITVISIALFLIVSCTAERRPLNTIDEAKTYIAENFKDSTETLWISDTLTDNTGADIIGASISIIGAHTLKAGYMPEGFEQENGYRIYKYKKM